MTTEEKIKQIIYQVKQHDKQMTVLIITELLGLKEDFKQLENELLDAQKINKTHQELVSELMSGEHKRIINMREDAIYVENCGTLTIEE